MPARRLSGGGLRRDWELGGFIRGRAVEVMRSYEAARMAEMKKEHGSKFGTRLGSHDIEKVTTINRTQPESHRVMTTV
jgi:hypothetical protein